MAGRKPFSRGRRRNHHLEPCRTGGTGGWRRRGRPGQEAVGDRPGPRPRGPHPRCPRQGSARALAEAKTPRYRTDEAGNVVPEIRAAAAIIYDPATGKVLYEENSQDERSIASITKVMTAIVFLETATDLNQEVQIVRADTLRASTTYLTHQRSGASVGPAAPAADSVGQRRGARAGPPLAAGL